MIFLNTISSKGKKVHKNLYKVLNIEPSATDDDIKQAYHKAAKENHPDVVGGNTDAMAIINKAYDVLKNADRRKRYDETGEENQINQDKEKIAAIVVQILKSLLDQNPNNIEIWIKNVRSSWQNDFNSALSKQKTEKVRLEKFLKRISHAPKNDIIGDMIKGTISAIDKNMLQMQQDHEFRLKAVDVFKKYNFTEEQTPQYVTMTFAQG